MAMVTQRSESVRGLVAVALLALLPSVVAFRPFQRQFTRGLTSGALRG